MSARPGSAEPCVELGDLVLVLLAGTLQGLSARLQSDGHEGAAELVADLVEVLDDYLDSMFGTNSGLRHGTYQDARTEARPQPESGTSTA